MTKNEFISELDKRLASLPLSEIEKTLAWYTEVIEDRIEDGMSEEEAVESLGSVDEIAEKIMYDTPLPVLVRESVRRSGARANKNGTFSKVLIAVLVILGFPVWFPIFASAAAVVITMYAVIWVVIACMFVVVLSLGAGAVGGVVIGAVNVPLAGMLGIAVIGCGVVCAGLCILSFFAAKIAAQGLIFLTKALVRGIKSMFIRREAAAV